MNYQETIEYLYNSAPLFQQLGGAAYKPGLQTTEALDEHFGHPHRLFKTIHVAGTNGKGSTAHTIAAVLQTAGYRVGLFTSPHLVDFRERIRVNGEMIPKDYVVEFVETEKSFFEPLHPSFFELTTALAFKYFAEAKVDVAVVEVGLGGRLDCTNIIHPELSVITNISLDHTQFLGHTLAEIASEKAGIIKAGVPVVVGEYVEETRPVFAERAKSVGTSIHFAEEEREVLRSEMTSRHTRTYVTKSWGDVEGQLSGDCQIKNTNTILCALNLLQQKFSFTLDDVHEAFRQVCSLTGLRGRWEVLQEKPMVVCDTGHNVGGWEYLAQQLRDNNYEKVHVVFGMAGDKDVDTVLSLMPVEAHYYFTKASVRRAMDEQTLQEKAARFHLLGDTYSNVMDAYHAALKNAAEGDLVYVGGSSFIVADLLSIL